ncbi:hypothetical protein R1flu_015688 [Riccia fluitans]|uniref:Prostaglandin E synthase 2 n=1 Tax=Riccia fluitans TaxID=41844 RepID=A0ABD1YMR2_9MARC
MRGRGIAILNSAVHRYVRATSSLVGSSGSVSSAIVEFSGVSSTARDERDRGAYERNFRSMKLDRGLVGIAAAGAFSASVAFSSISAALAKERVVADRMPKEVVLYQYEACPFCNKVKAFLDYRDIPYQVVEVNPVGKKELKWSDYKKVPVVVVDGQQLNDSTAIITSLNSRLGAPELSEEEVEEEEQWRRWVDGHLVHLLSPNIYRTTSEALEAFDYIAENGNFSRTERITAKYFGAAAMYFISKRLKKRHNISDERAALYEAAETWMKALGGRRFLGGEKPNLADLAVFGVLRPIRHLTAGEDMVKNTNIGIWYSNMEEAVGPSSRLPSNFEKAELGKPVESTVTRNRLVGTSFGEGQIIMTGSAHGSFRRDWQSTDVSSRKWKI